MKRNTVMALLVAVSTTAVSLGPQVPASAKDIECRYDIPRSVKNSVAAPVLPAVIPNYIYKISGVGPANPLHRSFDLARPRWSVVGVRPAAGTDYDAAAERCPDEPIATSANAGSAVEFVALDGNAAWTIPSSGTRTLYLAVRQAGSVTGQFTLEYATGGQPLRIGSPETLVIRETPALIRDVYVAGGTTAVITLRLSAGDADLAVVDSRGATPDTAARSRNQSIAQSNNPGLTPDTVSITVAPGEPGRTFGVVVVNNSTYGNYTLTRS